MVNEDSGQNSTRLLSIEIEIGGIRRLLGQVTLSFAHPCVFFNLQIEL